MIEMLKTPFMQQALAAGLMVGAVCAIIGIYVVLRRIIFTAIAVSQTCAAGIALGILMGMGHSAAMITGISISFIVMALFALHPSSITFRHENVIGFVYAASSSLAVVMLAVSAEGDFHILGLLRGNMETTINMSAVEKIGLAAVFIASLIFLSLFNKEILFVSFDPDTARASGISPARWDLMFYLILGAIISAAINICGLLLTFTYITVPAIISLLLVTSMKGLFLTSTIIALLSTFLGLFLSWQLYISYEIRLPAAPTISILCCIFLITAPIVRVWHNKRRYKCSQKAQ